MHTGKCSECKEEFTEVREGLSFEHGGQQLTTDPVRWIKCGCGKVCADDTQVKQARQDAIRCWDDMTVMVGLHGIPLVLRTLVGMARHHHNLSMTAKELRRRFCELDCRGLPSEDAFQVWLRAFRHLKDFVDAGKGRFDLGDFYRLIGGPWKWDELLRR